MMDFAKRRDVLKANLVKENVELAILTEESYIQYYTGFHGSLGIEWNRPRLLLIPVAGDPIIICPNMEEEMAHWQSGLNNILIWADGLDDEWRKPMREKLSKYAGKKIGVDYYYMPRVVWDFVAECVGGDSTLQDVAPIIDHQRMIKDADELQLARHAGQVAVAMLEGAMAAAAPGVREYEVSLAAKTAGAHKAAELMEKYYQEYDPFNYPCLSFQQIMASGTQTRMCHHRASMTKLEYGEPLFTCYCGTTSFNDFHLGFDRTLFVGAINDEVAKLLETAEKAQKAALAQVYPGNTAENVFLAYSEVITGAGFPIPFRAGRSLGLAVNENPQLAKGDKTILQEGMVFAVDGGANGTNYRTQVGDSLIVTATGYEIITPFTNDHEKLIVGR